MANEQVPPGSERDDSPRETGRTRVEDLSWELTEIIVEALGAVASVVVGLVHGKAAAVAWSGIDADTAARLVEMFAGAPFEVDTSILCDLDRQYTPQLTSLSGEPLRCCACHTVRPTSGLLYGWALALFPDQRPWTEPDARLLAMLARQMAGHADLFLLHEQMQAQVTELSVYRTYFDHGPDLMMRLGRNLEVQHMSSGWVRTLGYDLEFFLRNQGTGGMHLIHPDDVARVDAETRRVAGSDGGASGFEYRIKHQDGRWRWLSWSVLPINGELLAAARDITEQKRSEAMLVALAKAQQRYIQGADSSEVLGDILEQIQRFTESPLGFIAEVRRSPDGAPWLKTYALTNIAWSEETRAFYEANLKTGMEFRNLSSLYGTVLVTGKALLTNDPGHHSARGGTPEGHPTLTCFLGLPIENNGVMVGMVGLANREGGYQERDIEDLAPLLHLAAVLIQATRTEAERKRSSDALAASEARFRGLFEAAHDGWLIVDEGGFIEQANPSATHMFGYKGDALTGQDSRILVAPERRHRADAAYVLRARARFAANPGSVESTRGYRKDGTSFSAEFTFSELPFSEARFAVLVRDATERQRAERIKSEFVSTVSHELRTPLTSIRGALGLMAVQPNLFTEAEREELVQRALANADRLNHTLSDILDMERVSSGALTFHNLALSLAAAVRESAQANTTYAEMHGSWIELVEPLAEGMVWADPDRVAQVLNNLISNACKHSPAGRPVEISVSHVHGWLRASVRDHGEGVPPEFYDRIFLPFSQADASDTRARGGTGLGLSITRAIIVQLRGRINFGDAPGGGAVFWVDLPVWVAPSPAET